MNTEPCIKITPMRVVIAGGASVVFGAAAQASPEAIRIGVTAFLVCCTGWNCHVLYNTMTYKPCTSE